MLRPIHFEIHCDETERAAKFYTDIFGWKIQKWEHADYWLVMTGEKETPGIDGGLMKRMHPGTTLGDKMQAWVCTIDVPNCDEYVKKAEKAGGKNCVPKMAIPTVGWLAYCTDTEGNIFGLMESDPNAK